MYIYMNSTEINTSNRQTTVNTPNSSTVFSTSNRSTVVTSPLNRATMVNTLAVVGFIALIGASMWLAVYSTRYVPSVVTRLGTAAVYLGSVFTPSPESTLSVIPTASSTIISFGETNSTTETVTVAKSETPVASKQITPTAGQKTTNTYQIGGTAASTLSGLPDLVVSSIVTGYLTTTATDSFVASSTVPSNGTAAVNFTIKNVGTNVSGPWCFSATIPTSSSYLYQSQSQQSLNPGDSIEYTLGFTQANKGTDQMISVTANVVTPSCGNSIAESSTNNNSASAKVTISY